MTRGHMSDCTCTLLRTIAASISLDPGSELVDNQSVRLAGTIRSTLDSRRQRPGSASPKRARTIYSLTDDAILPRLTRLEMIGFKSFAQKTAFQFEPGITAVVGPNGSGKSNIADAVRWALGETSYSSLRSKKTEDVIFAGGTGRAPAGMAEVTLTFDNSTGWLPIDFTEVTVTRRAFRSGETAYLINGRKVRLKDVHQLTASLGQSYTVVGQGLVDAALSQRAEERRGLFEHAADLTGLRLKAAEAERNLAETESNSLRLTDLLADVEPRLRMLERAARQANEYRDMRDRLRAVQHGHFRGLLLAVNQRLAEVEEAALRRSLERGRDPVAARRPGRPGRGPSPRARSRLRPARRTPGRLAGHRAEQLRRVRHEREIASERLAALSQAARGHGGDPARSRRANRIRPGRAGRCGDAAASADQIAAEARVRRDEADAAVAAERAARNASEREHARLLALVTDRERQIADVSRRKALLVQRAETDAAERERNEATHAEREDRRTQLGADLAAFDAAARAAATRTEFIRGRQADLAAELDGATIEREAAQARTQESSRKLPGAGPASASCNGFTTVGPACFPV